MKLSFIPHFFQAVTCWPPDGDAVVRHAFDIGVKFGLAALDALHVAAAMSVGAQEFVTTEKSSNPLHRATDIRIRSTQTG